MSLKTIRARLEAATPFPSATAKWYPYRDAFADLSALEVAEAAKNLRAWIADQGILVPSEVAHIKVRSVAVCPMLDAALSALEELP